LEKNGKLEEKKKKEEEERANRERELVNSQWKRKIEAKAAVAKAAAVKFAVKYEARAKKSVKYASPTPSSGPCVCAMWTSCLFFFLLYN